MNPVTLHFLLHFYFMATPYTPNDSELVLNSVNWLTVNGLISPSVGDKDVCKCTPRGVAHIKQLIHLPLPQQKWVDFQGNEIKV